MESRFPGINAGVSSEDTMKQYWTDAELTILREVYAALPPGKRRKDELARRLPGRSAASIKSQIGSLGLARPATQQQNLRKGQGLAGRVYTALAQHGPLSVEALAELMGLTVPQVSSAMSCLVYKRSVVCESSQRPRIWRVKVTGSWENTQRRVNWEAGITEEDHAWMRHYRERRERRLALAGRA